MAGKTGFPVAGTNINAWGLMLGDAMSVLLQNQRFILSGESTGTLTLEAGSRFFMFNEENYTLPAGTATSNDAYPAGAAIDYNSPFAIFEKADVGFDISGYGDGTYYLICAGSSPASNSDIGKGDYLIYDDSTPAIDAAKGSVYWDSTNDGLCICSFVVSSGVISSITSYDVSHSEKADALSKTPTIVEYQNSSSTIVSFSTTIAENLWYYVPGHAITVPAGTWRLECIVTAVGIPTSTSVRVGLQATLSTTQPSSSGSATAHLNQDMEGHYFINDNTNAAKEFRATFYLTDIVTLSGDTTYYLSLLGVCVTNFGTTGLSTYTTRGAKTTLRAVKISEETA